MKIKNLLIGSLMAITGVIATAQPIYVTPNYSNPAYVNPVVPVTPLYPNSVYSMPSRGYHDRDDNFERVQLVKTSRNRFEVVRGLRMLPRERVYLETRGYCGINSGWSNLNLNRNETRGVLVTGNRECIVDVFKVRNGNGHYRR